MAQVRMYVNKGCPNCETAQKFFEDQGITVEAIEVGFDPIAQAGIRGLTPGQKVPAPIIISFGTQEVILGSDPIHLQRIVNGFRSVPPDTGSSTEQVI